jgi:hypothetical protein
VTFPRTPGDLVCDAFRTAVDAQSLSHVEVGAAIATLIAGWLSSLSPASFATEEQVDSVMEMLTDTVKVSLEEHRKLLATMPAESKRESPFA